MPLAYFAPTKSIKGGALFVKFISKEECAFLEFHKQTANNPNKKDNFDFKNPKNKIVVKLSKDEIGGFIRVIRTKRELSSFHSFDSNNTTISFKYYALDTQDGKKKEGFSFSVGKTASGVKTQVTLSLSLDQAETLMEYLRFALDHIFSAIYAADKKRNEEYFKKQNDKQAEPADSEDAADDFLDDAPAIAKKLSKQYKSAIEADAEEDDFMATETDESASEEKKDDEWI